MSDTTGTPEPATPPTPEGSEPRYAPPLTPPQPQYAQPIYAPPEYAAPGATAPGYGAPGSPGSPGSPQTPPPQRGLSTGAIVGIVLGAVALGTAILLVLGFTLLGNLFRDSSPETAPPADPQAGTVAVTAVEGYLAALAEGDAEAAKSFLSSYTETAFLTDEIAQRSIELAPITNISVDPAPDTSYSPRDFEVEAQFSVDGRTVERTFGVFVKNDDTAELVDATEMFSGNGFSTHFDATINGAPFPDDYAELFPGTYEMSLDSELFELEATNGTITKQGTVVPLLGEEDRVNLYSVNPRLTPAGIETFRSLVTASLEECLALTTPTTPCGMDVPTQLDGAGAPIDGTAKRSLPPESTALLSRLETSLSPDAPTVARTTQYLPIDLTVEVEQDGERTTEKVYDTSLRQPSVDFGTETLEVTWY